MIGSTTAKSRRWPPVQEACTIRAFSTKCDVYAKGVRGSSARTPFLFCCSERQEYRLAVSSLPERSGQQSPQAPGQTIWNESEDGADILWRQFVALSSRGQIQVDFAAGNKING